jgi:suppressor of ftsI
MLHPKLRSAAALALAAAPLLATACTRPPASTPAPGPAAQPQAIYLGRPYAAPQPIHSSGGVFSTRLVADTGSYVADGQPRPTVMFNRTMNPPVLRMSPGDRVDMRVMNAMPDSAQSYTAWTNYHYHGFNVPPMPPGDNVVFIEIGQDSSYQYQFPLSRDIPQGLHWYHPHPHGISQMQVQRGMSGVISVGNVLGEAGYDSAAIAERFLLLRDFSWYTPDAGPWNACWGPNRPFPLMNGQPLTHMTARPGETQFWRIANVGSDRVYNLQLRGKKSGRLPFHVIARDGNLSAVEYDTDSLMIAPGNRYEVLVRAPATADTLQFWSPALDRDPTCTFPAVTFANVTVDAGAPRMQAVAFETEGSSVQADTMRMLREVARPDTFTVVFSRYASGDTLNFLINDSVYSPTRTDRTIAVGAPQEWTIVNDDDDLHAFHIHQGDFQVVAQRDSGSAVWEPVDPNGRIDTILVPRHAAVKIRFVYTSAQLAGMFVYHCHMLFHEDRGMMQNLCLYDPNSGKTPAEQCANPFSSGSGGGMHGGH